MRKQTKQNKKDLKVRKDAYGNYRCGREKAAT